MPRSLVPAALALIILAACGSEGARGKKFAVTGENHPLRGRRQATRHAANRGGYAFDLRSC